MKQQRSTAKIKNYNNDEENIVSYETGEMLNFRNALKDKQNKDKQNIKNKNLHNKKIGILGEDFACEYLENIGFKIIERNFAVKFGEIDIIAVSYETIAFKDQVKKVYIIEVKTSVSHENSQIKAIENVTFKKLQKIAKVGEFYVKEKFVPETPFSICVCAVYLNKDLSLQKIDFVKDIEI